MPPVRFRQPTSTQPAAEMVGEPGLVGPGADRLGEVDVGVRVGRDPPGHRRQRPHQVAEVEPAERRVDRSAELADHQAPARPGDPGHLPQRRRRCPRCCAARTRWSQRRTRRRRTAAPARRRRAAAPPAGPAARPAACPARGRRPIRTRPSGQLLGGHSGAGGQVEAALARAAGPAPSGSPAARTGPAEGEDRVRPVVARGDAVEHRRDLVRLLLQRRPAHDDRDASRVDAASGSAIDEKCDRTRSSVGSSAGVQCTRRCR